MSGKSASLLTKTQRTRIRDDFADLNEDKERRDQQRIRERVRSGLFDFQHLADYPDRQFELMFDDADDDLRAALADATIVIERLREQNEIERDELVAAVRDHVERYNDTADDTQTLERIDLRTAAEIRRQTEDEFRERFEPGRWDKRAAGLMKLGVGVFIPILLIVLLGYSPNDWVIPQPLTVPFSILMVLLFVTATGWLLIKTVQSLKYNIFPFFVELTRDPKTALTDAIKSPGNTVRESWDEL